MGAVEVLYRTESPRLWRALYGYAMDRSVADNAVAEAFAQLLRRGDAVRDPRAWIWRTAFRLAAGDLQRQRRNANEVLIDITVNGPEDTVDLIAALRRLSEKQRRAVVLHDYAGYRCAEVAEMIGSTEAAVRVHLMRARRRLRTDLA